MSEPWFEPNTFGALFGAIVGGVGGTFAGLVGALAGVLAPRGKGRRLVLGLMEWFVALGVALLIFGLVALVCGQPFGIWYGPVLSGVLSIAVMGGLIPMVRARYRQAEQRKLDAEGLRRS